MITKEEMESKRALKAKSVVDEQLDSFIEWNFIKKGLDSFSFRFDSDDYPYYGVTIETFREQLEVYVHSGGYSGYEIKDDTITFRR